jgi:hypothetical protein
MKMNLLQKLGQPSAPARFGRSGGGVICSLAQDAHQQYRGTWQRRTICRMPHLRPWSSSLNDRRSKPSRLPRTPCYSQPKQLISGVNAGGRKLRAVICSEEKEILPIY